MQSGVIEADPSFQSLYLYYSNNRRAVPRELQC
jgi:hypothetical protein